MVVNAGHCLEDLGISYGERILETDTKDLKREGNKLSIFMFILKQQEI